ncbi:MAG: hypothetical protein QOE44_1972 [Solirubrobacteraceae bacterium]|nr:hypothetical protein [Solirubrobacteraceae bacterium]
MTGAVILHQLLLAAGVASLGGAGLRLASTLAPGGLERVLAGFTFGAAAAGLEALVLGLAGLGGDAAALTLAGLGTYAVARTLVPGPELPVGAELARWLRTSAPPVVAGVGAGAAIVVAWAAWQVRHPLIGPDALTYHLPIATAWVQNGRPGSLVSVLDGFPFGSYPLTNELLVAWALGISRGWVAVSIWSPVLFVGVVLGGWVALRELGVDPFERVLAVIAVCVPPLMVGQLGAPYTDIAALAWLAIAGGLACAARRQPGLVYPAVVAAALCVGTKTTPAVLVLALGVMARRPLRAGRPAGLACALGVGVAVGGIWAVRDLIDHGSPLWPLAAAPWGDPVPAAFRALQARFLDHPRHLLGAYWRDYLAVLGGGAVLLGSGIALPLVRRSRAALGSAGAAALALLAWGVAPYTGLDTFGAAGAIANTRYLLPAMAACAVATAVSAVGAGPGLRWIVRGALVGSIAYSVVKTAAFGPLRPSLGTLVAAAGAGVVAAGVCRVRPLGVDRRVVAGLFGAAGVVGLAFGAHGYVGRYLAADNPPDRALYALPAVSRGTVSIASFPGVFVLLRGDRLEHPVGLIGPREGCGAIRARLGRGPVAVARQPESAGRRRVVRCLKGVHVVGVGPFVDVYA